MAEQTLLQPGQIIRPPVTSDSVPQLVRRIFGLEVTSVKELKSYDDKNFLIQVKNGYENPYIESLWPAGYVLKILNSMDSKNTSLVEGQNLLMLFMKERGFNTPVPMRSVEGSYMVKERISIHNDQVMENDEREPSSYNEYIVRLLTFIPAKTLYDVPYTTELFYESGIYIGEMDQALKDFHNDAIENRCGIWKLDSVPELSKFAYVVRNKERHKLICEILQAWDDRVEPLLPSLEKGIIHGDFNEQNILVNADHNDPSHYHIYGVIDFGDVSAGSYVFELAITIMYMMVEANQVPSNDAGGYVIAGYLKKRSLSQKEWEILKICVAARFAQSLVMGAYTHEQDPGNEYVLVTSTKGWSVLDNFWKTPDDEIIRKWKSIAQSY
ncbi:hydroxylysine kinase [Oratosquilla oratoria]|uniref:hydroxylysine kinase n=1 Tax=Oratosquilla oratoria TaxID=337810 RepID=UPI003F75F2A3